jgi:hypothetical protein
MNYTVKIQDRATGEVSARYMGDGVHWGESSEFWWTDGNYGCDCNRFATFLRGKGVPEEKVAGMEWPCRYDKYPDGRFRVVEIVLTDGTVVYGEDPWAPPAGAAPEKHPLRDLSLFGALDGKRCVLCREAFTVENAVDLAPRLVWKDPMEYACTDCLARKGALMLRESIKEGEYPSVRRPPNGGSGGCRGQTTVTESFMKDREAQERLMDQWKGVPKGTRVVVTKDDGTEVLTETRSGGFLLGGHTACIMLEGISGCYSLERVRKIGVVENNRDR